MPNFASGFREFPVPNLRDDPEHFVYRHPPVDMPVVVGDLNLVLTGSRHQMCVEPTSDFDEYDITLLKQRRDNWLYSDRLPMLDERSHGITALAVSLYLFAFG
jgi:hypothetical protein